MKKFARLNGNLSYGWFRIWILMGMGLAILLLVNSISNYFLLSQRILVSQLRRDLAKEAASLDRRIQESSLGRVRALNSFLEDVKDNGPAKIAWIQIRDSDDSAIAGAGIPPGPTFSTDFVRSQIFNRQPVFREMETKTGRVLVEAFPFRMPAAFRNVLIPAAAHTSSTPRAFGILEIAVPLDGRNTTFWPLRRSLMIDCAAALALLVSLAVMAIRFRSYLQGKELEKQVEIARRVQQDLFPSEHQYPDQFEFAAECLPASQVSGDFYDVFAVNGKGTAFVLGDVSGKGIPAALLMGVLHGAVRSTLWTESPHHHEEATRRINRLLWEHAARERFATMFWSYFDPETRILRYINAGHLPPLLFEKGVKTPFRLTDGGPVLGLLPDVWYRQGEVYLEPGDVLVLYSDGVVEAANADGEQFGCDRLAEVIERYRQATADDIRVRVLSAVREFTGTVAPDDDRTLLVIRYQDGAASYQDAAASVIEDESSVPAVQAVSVPLAAK